MILKDISVRIYTSGVRMRTVQSGHCTENSYQLKKLVNDSLYARNRSYSILRLSTGFIRAVLMDW